MNSSIVSAKQFQLAIKNGLTPEDLAEKHGIDVDELKNQLKHLYNAGDGSKAQSIFGQLAANRKKSRKRKVVVAIPQTEMVEQPDTEDAQKEEPAKSLSDYQEEEKSLSSEVMHLESEHKELSGQHRACIKELRDLQEQIEAIKKELIGCKAKYEKIVENADVVATQMNNLSALRREKLVALERVRQEIEELSRITLCVTADGNIEAPDNPDFVLNDEGYRDVKAEIAEREECLDLRVRDVTTLARLLKICEGVEHLTLICDHAELEKVFWTIRQ